MMYFLLLFPLVAIGLAVIGSVLGKKAPGKSARTKYDFDAIIVGGSIAGPTMAKALSDQGRSVLLVERELWQKPNRIVGELLQPGGIEALKQLQLEDCALSVGSLCTGYAVQDDNKNWVKLPFRTGYKGVSFHFGDFVNCLRRRVYEKCSKSVEMIEGTVTAVLTEVRDDEERAYGIRYRKNSNYKVPKTPFADDGPDSLPQDDCKPADITSVTLEATAPVVIMCDGGGSKFKSKFGHYRPASNYHSHFVGLILQKAELPHETKGTVFLGRTGPILSYRLDSGEVRLLVDYPNPKLPGLDEQQRWLTEEIAPQMTDSMRDACREAAKDVKNIRSMPIACYKSLYPAKDGFVAIGDHGNQRHPLTGGGMTCAFRDALNLAASLAKLPKLRGETEAEQINIDAKIHDAVVHYARTRFIHSSCINILSWALYAVFGGPPSMRRACFDYFLLGDDAVSGPMDLLSGLNSSLLTLLYHYSRVMVCGAYNLVTLSGSYAGYRGDGTLKRNTPVEQLTNTLLFFISPVRLFTAIYLLCYSIYVFLPLAMMEMTSLWRVVDPISPLATKVLRPLETSVTKALRPAGKPVSL